MARGIDITRYNADAKALVRQLQMWSKGVRKDSQKILRPAGEVIRNEIRARTPVFPRRHYRYRNGNKVAEYYPGNLRRSIDDLFLRQTPGVFIGPKIGGSTGTFSGTRTDGYYASWVDRGAPARGIRPRRFISKGVRAARPRAIQIVIRNLKQMVKQL